MKLPLITSAPHDGDSFSTFSPRVALTPWQIGEFSDKYTAVTAYHPDALGNLKSTVTRGLGSLNQPRDISLFKTADFHGNTIWKEGASLTTEEKDFCFKQYWDPYHNEIKSLIKKSKQMGFDKVILWDHHDTGDYDERTHKRDRKLPEENRIMPKFILSNAGFTCPDSFLKQVQKFISDEFKLPVSEVELNTIYKGGYIVQTYGDPKNDYGNTVWAIQIEYNRGFVMDQATRIPKKEEIKEMNLKFKKVMENACKILSNN